MFICDLTGCNNNNNALLSDGFINDLNGVTRLMVYLGTVQPKTATQQLHYVYMPAANHHLSEAGSTVVLDNSMFRGQHQVRSLDIDLRVASDNSRRPVGDRYVHQRGTWGQVYS